MICVPRQRLVYEYLVFYYFALFFNHCPSIHSTAGVQPARLCFPDCLKQARSGSAISPALQSSKPTMQQQQQEQQQQAATFEPDWGEEPAFDNGPGQPHALHSCQKA